MRVIIGFLNQAIGFLGLAAFVSRSLDPNTTGKDDVEIPQFLERISEEIKLFIGTHQVTETGTATGYGQTLAFCNSVIQSLDLIITSSLSKEVKLEQANILVSSLSDSSKVYQAKKGSDAAVLAETKIKAQERLKRIV